MIISDLMPDALARVEELVPPNGPIFWSLIGEVYPMMVDAMFEASILTGVTQAINQRYTIQPNTTYFTLPQGAMGVLRLKAPYPIRKTSLKEMDDMLPSWQNATPGTQIQAWFPVGITKFGIYPQLSEESVAVLDWIVSPVIEQRPYNGSEVIPFQEEFTDSFAQYAAAMLRAKEGGAEAEEASEVYQEYMSGMKALSMFQNRLDRLVKTFSSGGIVRMNRRTVA